MKTHIQYLFLTLSILAGARQAVAQTSFLLSSNYTVGNGPSSVAAFKNVNGNVDMVCANNLDGTLTLLTNIGGGIFASAANYYAGSGCGHVVVFTNTDGRINWFCANSYISSLTIFTNDESGDFGYKTNLYGGTFPDSVAAADVNGDGKVDLICVNGGSDNLTVFTNNGGDGFLVSGNPATGHGPHTVVVADVNNDGKPDLMCINTDDTVSVLTNNGMGIFAPSGTYASGGASAQEGFTAADVNGDGYVDLIAANTGAGSISVLTNKGDGTFASPANYLVGNTTSVVAFTNVDDKVDLACAVGNMLIVLTNDGSGIFIPACTNIVGNYPYITAADVNGDGKVDLICANSGGNTVSVLFNTSTFTTPTPPLSIASIGNQTVLFWQASATNYILQSATNINATNWVTASDAVPVIAVTVTNSAPARFFRLQPQ